MKSSEQPSATRIISRPGGGRCVAWAVTACLWVSLLGCSPETVQNPSFDLTVKDAKGALKQMRRDPVTLYRPVVVIGGWSDVVGVAPAHIAEQLKKATGDPRIIMVGGGIGVTFDDCRRRVLNKVESAFPSDDPVWTREVDVVGFSMGGLTARYAASETEDGQAHKRLRIARLYTIATPHRGAVMADNDTPIDPLARDMHPDSPFIARLNAQRARESYRIVPYVSLKDGVVGAPNAAPPGVTPWWLPAEPFTRPHGGAYHDPRFIADMARRLRGETPYTTEPVAALPRDGDSDATDSK